MPAFRIEAVRSSQTCTLSLHGEVDLAVADELVRVGTAKLAEPDTTSLVIDTHGVTFIDSTGLGALLALRNRARASNKNFQLVLVPDRVREVLEFAGLNAVFDVPNPEQ